MVPQLSVKARSTSLDRSSYEAVSRDIFSTNLPRGRHMRCSSASSLCSAGDDSGLGLFASSLPDGNINVGGSGSSGFSVDSRPQLINRGMNNGMNSVQGSLANILPVLADSNDQKDDNESLDRSRNQRLGSGCSFDSIVLDDSPDSEMQRSRVGSSTALLKDEDTTMILSSAAYLGNHYESERSRTESMATSLRKTLTGTSRTESDASLGLELGERLGQHQSWDEEEHEMRRGMLRTPGQIRTSVLEWMYEENGVLDCPDLSVKNIGILEDLISVFVCVVLQGKSDRIRSLVWRFLIDGSVVSLHFAVLVICNLNASCHQPQDVDEDETSLEHKDKRAKDLHLIEQAIITLKKESLTAIPPSSGGGNKNEDLKGSIMRVLEQLETVHDNQVLTNLDLNQRGRTARQNTDMLISKVRSAITKHHTVQEDERLEDLDGKLGFIKMLTDLDDWLIKNVPRDGRHAALVTKLQSLAVALPHGAYLPTAVGDATERHRILRLVLDETIVFNTAEKCPFLLVAEVEPILSDDHDLFDQLSGTTIIDLNGNGKLESSSNKKAADDENQPPSPLASSSINNTGIANDKDKEHRQQIAQEKWEDMGERIQRTSPFGQRPNWKLASMFVKSGDDLRQQQLGILFVSTFQKIFLEEGVPVWLSPYKVIATGRSCGLLEPARNSDSIARIKERGGFDGINQYFLSRYGNRDSRGYKRAQKNFLQSLVGYSIVAYLIKLHDRHNGNILLDLEGHCLHIDYGFMLGYSHKLELSPFKLTNDMVAVLDGPHSPTFQKFRRLMEKAYIAANKHARELVLLAELMSVDESSSACFAGGRRWVIDEFRARFNPGLTTRKLRAHINDVIDASLVNFSTRMYDRWQRCVNGIW